MNIVYNKINGIIEGVLDDKINYKIYYSHFPQEFQENIDCIKVENPPRDLENYVVKNGKIVRRFESEIEEIKKYGKILTEEEKLNIALQPSHEEITKAKAMLEILPILEEVRI